MNDEINNRIEEFTQKLELRLDKLRELNISSQQSRKTVTLDQSRVGRLSRMDALQGQAMAAETARRRDMEIERIKAALLRIQSDDFGYCLICDEEISFKRLENDPSTPTCVRCAGRSS